MPVSVPAPLKKRSVGSHLSELQQFQLEQKGHAELLGDNHSMRCNENCSQRQLHSQVDDQRKAPSSSLASQFALLQPQTTPIDATAGWAVEGAARF